MIWDVIVINLVITGLALSGLLLWLKKSQTRNRFRKLFSRMILAIRLRMRTAIQGIKQKSLYTRSSEITVTKLIQLLDGDVSAVKKRWYALKKWQIVASNELTEEAYQHLNRDEFNKQNITYQKIVEKTAMIQHLQTELFILKTKIETNYTDIDNCATFKRYSLDWKDADFTNKFNKLIKKLESELIKYSTFIASPKMENKISFEDAIIEQLIIINGGLIDKNSITAKDFYTMLHNFKKNNDGLRNK